MRKIMLIARREYRATVRTKAFLISILIMPLMLGAMALIQPILRGRVDVDDKKIMIVDHTEILMDDLLAAANARNEKDIFDRDTAKQIHSKYLLEAVPPATADEEVLLGLSERVRKNELFAFAEIGAGALLPSSSEGDGGLKFYSENVTNRAPGRWLRATINTLVVARRLESSGLDADVVRDAIAPVAFENLGLFERTDTGEIKKAEAASEIVGILLPYAIMMLMFMSVMISAQPMLHSVIEEKQLRIAEVLLGSANPFQIMMGKLLGNVGVSLTIVSVYILGAFVLAGQFSNESVNYVDKIPTHIIGWFIVYQILAAFLFGSVFIAIGAACTEIKEAQNFLTPVMLLMVIPLMIFPLILRDPSGSFATWISFFPPTTPMLMMLRMSATRALPLWQPLVGIVVVLVATLLCVFAAGRVFRIGILVQGKAPKLTELARWVISG